MSDPNRSPDDMLARALEHECFHSSADREDACYADGGCPICLAQLVYRQAEQIKKLQESPRPDNAELYTCSCGWNGTIDEMDAGGSKEGCCPKCGNEDLPTIAELYERLQQTLKGKADGKD